MHTAKNVRAGAEKGVEKSKKCHNEKDRRRKDALSKAYMGEKDVGEMIGGAYLLAMVL